MPKRRNDASINIRVSRKDLRLIDNCAAALGITRSAFLRQSAEASAKRVIAKAKELQSR